MKQVASTDQKGHLIILAGKAIDITGEGQRDAETLQALIDHLQAFKEGKPYPPPSAPALSCCGYPHYDDPKRPNYGPNQVGYLCQLYPGLRVRWYNTQHVQKGEPRLITSYPIRRGNQWWVTTQYTEEAGTQMNGIESETSLDDMNVVGGPGTYYPNWNPSNWLGFENAHQHDHHSCHHPCCHR